MRGESAHPESGHGDPHGTSTGPASQSEDEIGDVMVAMEVAGLLRVNVKTVYDLAKTGEIPSWRLGRHFRFSRRVLVALLGQCKSASPQKGR
jgi:excisionase family DNA binding protein